VLVAHVPFDVTALDIGCGGGLFLALLAMLGRRVQGVGIDSSKPAIRCAQQVSAEINKRSLGSNLRFYLLSPDQPLPQEPFDIVSIIDVMHHVPPAGQRRFFEAAVERVAPGGLLLYKDLAIAPLWRRLASQLHDLIIAQQFINEVPVAVARQWAESAGLVCVDAGPANRLWYGHEFGIFRKPSLPATKI
jgi:2-polyprenyl-3-methyl-5-hydroxy-6-metoxy-1,4-benzoquinol methylase